MDKVAEELNRMKRRLHLSTLDRVDRQIVGIYQRAAKDLATKAGRAKAGSLTERWVTDYLRSVNDRLGELRGEVGEAVGTGMRASAKAQADAAERWMTTAFGQAGMDQSFTGTFSRTPDEALRSILRGKMYSDGKTLSKRIWNETGRLQYGIEEIVSQGIAQKMSAYELAKMLEAYVNPEAAAPVDWRSLYPDIPFEVRVDYNAQRLARTAINHAHWGANKAIAAQNPFCKAMHWELSSSHYERQVSKWGEDICDEYARHDEGLGAGNYPIAALPMPHPQCLCSQWQVLPELDDAAARLKAWDAGASDPDMEKAYQEWLKVNQ